MTTICGDRGGLMKANHRAKPKSDPEILNGLNGAQRLNGLNRFRPL
jgi:hypothetical protein